MKHRLEDDVDVNLNVNLPTKDIADLVDHITDSAVVVIGFYMLASTAKALLVNRPSRTWHV